MTKSIICNKIITRDTIILKTKGEQKMDIAIIMPVIAAISSMFIIAILLINNSKEKRERIKSVDVIQFNSFIEQIKHENTEMKKDLQTVKEKVEAIDKMMKDI